MTDNVLMQFAPRHIRAIGSWQWPTTDFVVSTFDDSGNMIVEQLFRASEPAHFVKAVREFRERMYRYEIPTSLSLMDIVRAVRNDGFIFSQTTPATRTVVLYAAA